MILASLNTDVDTWDSLSDFGGYPAGTTVGEAKPMFARLDEEKKLEEIYAEIGVDDEPEMEPVKPEITIEDFEKLDLRVCEILKAQEIRKSHSCLKLTLDDGSGENRVIVSSIKSEYTCEQLIGKKIIVVANLEPARFAGVQSNGMLLAATNGACGCQVVFVPDCVPAGTQIK